MEKRTFNRYLSGADVWVLSLGCIIGWGVFMMPGTTFLPAAGPTGHGYCHAHKRRDHACDRGELPL